MGLLRDRHVDDVQRPRLRARDHWRLEEIKKKYLGMLVEEPKLASFCLTEPEAGSDVGSMRTRAVKQGDKYVINGSKVFITNGSHASWYTVYAKTDPDKGHKGISAFVVPRDRPACRSRRRRTSSVSAPPTPRRSSSRTSRSPRRTCSARRTTASGSR